MAPASGATQLPAASSQGMTSTLVQSAPLAPSGTQELVSDGQYVSISQWGLVCGSNERTTDSYVKGLVQVAMMYRHCTTGTGSVYRKADARYAQDGYCREIRANTARVIQVMYVIPFRDAFGNAYAC